jgi:hypothetical protein
VYSTSLRMGTLHNRAKHPKAHIPLPLFSDLKASLHIPTPDSDKIVQRPTVSLPALPSLSSVWLTDQRYAKLVFDASLFLGLSDPIFHINTRFLLAQIFSRINHTIVITMPVNWKSADAMDRLLGALIAAHPSLKASFTS